MCWIIQSIMIDLLHRELKRLNIEHDYVRRTDGTSKLLGSHIITVYRPYTSIVRNGKHFEVYGNGSQKLLKLKDTIQYVRSSRNR